MSDTGLGKASEQKGGNWSIYRPQSKPLSGQTDRGLRAFIKLDEVCEVEEYGCTYTLGPAHQGAGKREKFNYSL